MNKKTVLFSESPAHIESALVRMREAHEELPFVIIEREPRPGPFVQFCTSYKGNISFDVPQMNIVANQDMPISVPTALALAESHLRWLGVTDDELVSIIEDNSSPPWRRAKQWLKKKLKTLDSWGEPQEA